MHIQKSSKFSVRNGYLLLFALCMITFFVNLGKAPIYILDEAKNAQCAREMLQRHDWVVPTFNQQLRTDKPPLHYFFMSAAYGIFGVNEFAARFFSAVCGLLTVMITYRFACKHVNTQVAWLSALILLGSWQFGLEMRMAVPDPYLILLITSSLYFFYEFYASSGNKPRYLFYFYVCIGLGILSKGPVALILPVIIGLVFLLLQRQLTWLTIKMFKPWFGLMLVALISLPWYYLVDKQTHGEWTKDFFFTHNFERFVGPKEKHGGFFLKTILFVLIGLLPVSVFSIHAITKAFKICRQHTLTCYLLIVVSVIVLFFTFAQTRLPNYAMPCYPFLSILLAGYINTLIVENKGIKPFVGIIFLISTAVPAALYIIVRKEPALHTLTNLWIPFLMLPLFIAIAFIWQYKGTGHTTRLSIYMVLGGFITTGWLLNFYAYPTVYKQNPVLATLKNGPTPEPLVSYRMYNASYNFYLKQPVQRFEDPKSLMQYLDAHPRAKIVTREKYLHELDGLPFRVYYEGKDIFESHTNYLLRYK